MNDSILAQTELLPYRGGLWYADPKCRAMKAVEYLETVLGSGRPLLQLDIDTVVRQVELKFITHINIAAASTSPELLVVNGGWEVVDSKCPEMRAVRYLETVLKRPLTRLDIDSVARFLPITFICKLEPAKND